MATTREKYELLIGPIRQAAHSLGYAVAVHGSLNRDIDLIACPWTTEAVPARELAERIFAVVEQVNGVAWWSWSMARPGPEFTLDGCPGVKPHGRLGWGINLGGGPYIDLSVMPRMARRDLISQDCRAQHPDRNLQGDRT